MATTNVSTLGQGDLTRYFQAIRALPMLTSEQEVSLAKRWRERNETAAMQTLVSSHLRLVAKIAVGYRGYGLPLDDLIAEGNIGMMQAVKRFDPDRGFRLATYAMWWIRASIQEYILRSWSLVKMGTTAAQKKLFFNLRRIKGQLSAIDEGDLSPENVQKIAHRLDVSEQDVVSMNRRLAAPDHSLNAPMRVDGEGQMQDWLVDERPNQEVELTTRKEQQDRKARLARAMQQLSERERHILTERRLKDEPTKLDILATDYGLSRERIRQIENRALEKLRYAMTRGTATDVVAERSASAPKQNGIRLPSVFTQAEPAQPASWAL
jgi:RNA polymerase sigma-32 factor